MLSADLAQLVERVAFNHVVVGSNPTVGEAFYIIPTILWGKSSVLARLPFVVKNFPRKKKPK